MYTSSPDFLKILSVWRRQRLSHALFIPVAMTLVVASLVGTDWPSLSGLVLRVAAAWVAVFALRLWDDLEDVSRDRELHPERVLTQVINLRPFVVVVGALFPIVWLLIFFGGGEPTAWMVLVATLAIFYRLNIRTQPGADFGILLKYPVLVLALGGSLQPVGLSVMALVLSAIVMDEIFQRSSRERLHVVAGSVCLVGSAVALVLQTEPSGYVLALQSALVIGMLGLSLQSLFGKPQPKLQRAGLLAMTLFFLLLCNAQNFAEFIDVH